MRTRCKCTSKMYCDRHAEERVIAYEAARAARPAHIAKQEDEAVLVAAQALRDLLDSL